MGISLNPLANINPGSMGNSLPVSHPFQDAGQQFLQAYLQTRDQKQRASISSAELDLKKQELSLLMAQEKTKQEQLKHAQEVTNQQGEASRLYLEHALPHMAANGQLQQMLQQQGSPMGDAASQAVGAGAAAVPQNTDQYQQFVRGMDPQALAGFAQHVLPALQQAVQQEKRDQIAGKFPSAENETPAMMRARLQKMSAAYAGIGDHSMVASLAETLGSLKPDKADYTWFQKKDGTTVYLPKDEGSRLGLQKPSVTSGFGFGPGGPLGIIRSISAIAGMDDADQKMKRYEVRAAGKQVDYTDFNYFQGQLATLYNDARKETGVLGHLVPFFGTASGSAVLARLNRTNPELANYLQSAAQWALEDAQLQNRPSDFKIKMDEFVSALKPDAKVQSIHDLWRSRSVRLNGYKQGLPMLQRIMDRAASMPVTPGTSIVPDPEEP